MIYNFEMIINLEHINTNNKFRAEKKLGFVDSEFVKTCDELVIGQVHLMVGKISCGTQLVKWWDLLEKLKLLFRKEKSMGNENKTVPHFYRRKTKTQCSAYRIIHSNSCYFLPLYKLVKLVAPKLVVIGQSNLSTS